MTTQEFTKKIESGEAKVLTLAAANELKGKTIHTMYYGYRGNYLSVETFVVGEVVSELEYYRTQPADGWNNRAEYWESYMTEDQLRRTREKMMLLDGDGKSTFIYIPEKYCRWCGEDVFVCSEDDRQVYFVEA